MYVSSKVVDALVKMKQHTEELSMKRSLQKEQLLMNPKKRVIDENVILHNTSDNELEDDEEEDDQYEDRSDINSQYFNESVNQGEIPDDTTVKSGGTMNRINFNASSAYGGTAVGRQQTQEGSNLEITDQLETETNTLYKSKNTSSKKSLKSIGINDRKGSRKQLININQDDDGSKIQIMGNLAKTSSDFKNDMRAKYAFSPLIQHLLRQRDLAQNKLPTLNRTGFKSTSTFGSTQGSQPKIQEKIVFMQVAGTMNMINNQKRLLTTSTGRMYSPFSQNKLPHLTH